MNEDFYIEFVFFIKKKNKNVKLIWNKNKGFTDNELIELFGLDDDETIRVQIEILGAKLFTDIDKEYIDYFNNNYSLEDYKALFDTFYYKDPRSKLEHVIEDIEISYNCQVGYSKVANSFFSEFVTWYWYDNDIDFLEDELGCSYNESIKNNIKKILNFKDFKKIREEIEKQEIYILENKKEGGFYYFFENHTLFI